MTNVRKHLKITQFPDGQAYDSSHVGADTSVQFSDILQCEDGLSVSSFNDSVNNCESEDEVDSNSVRVVLVPSVVQSPSGAPLQLEVDTTGNARSPTCIPSCAITNPRSA